MVGAKRPLKPPSNKMISLPREDTRHWIQSISGDIQVLGPPLATRNTFRGIDSSGSIRRLNPKDIASRHPEGVGSVPDSIPHAEALVCSFRRIGPRVNLYNWVSLKSHPDITTVCHNIPATMRLSPLAGVQGRCYTLGTFLFAEWFDLNWFGRIYQRSPAKILKQLHRGRLIWKKLGEPPRPLPNVKTTIRQNQRMPATQR